MKDKIFIVRVSGQRMCSQREVVACFLHHGLGRHHRVRASVGSTAFYSREVVVDMKTVSVQHASLRSPRGSPGTLVAVTAVRGSTAKLPCRISSDNPSEPVLLVLWYKNASVTPVYRYVTFDSTKQTQLIAGANLL
ncbi:hypothetical protein E2C01_030503 [Portunus trituberculatus]|uniref:Ig-like domain-containing protein n=1 Tax=Portunus trituberculatus TaxID=210409 RepID=A0A5B7EQL3_PORTR|nr:hypothetical protein [Portunus trituberculatus]